MFVCAGGVQETADGRLFLPEVASQADIIRCIATWRIKKEKLRAGICVMQGKDVELSDVHNAIESLGGFAEVRKGGCLKPGSTNALFEMSTLLYIIILSACSGPFEVSKRGI